MEERKREIIKIVENLYYGSNLENANLNNWIQFALNTYLNTSLSVDEIRTHLELEIQKKILLAQIKHNYYEKYHLAIRVAESIGNVPEKEIEELLVSNYNLLGTINNEAMVEIVSRQFQKYRNSNVEIDHNTPKLIESVLASEETKKLLTSIFSNESTMGEHGQLNISGDILSYNIMRNNKIIDFIVKYLIIHRQAFDLEELYSKIQKANINEKNEKELQEFFSETILLSLQKRFSIQNPELIEAKQQIANFIYQNYIEQGYCFQGINGTFKESVNKNGLTSKFSSQNSSDLEEIDTIFKSHGLDKIFFSKLDETEIAPYYYLTDSVDTAYHYSYHNPEWFSYFVATGNNMPDNEYDRTAYYRRDYEACKNNLIKLCNHYSLTAEETNLILGKFDKFWSQIVLENQDNSMVFVQRNLINRNKTSLNMESLSEKTSTEIISELLSSDYNIDIQYIDIPKEYIDVIDVPPMSKLYDKEKIDRASKQKYIKLKSGDKYYYDILIHADEVDFDCISISNDSSPILETVQSHFDTPIDIIHCPNDINKQTILENGSISYQSLEMLIAVNGIANSEEGIKLIEQSRKDFSPEYMQNYYYHLSQFFCNMASDETYTIGERASVLYRMAKDIYPKAELMRTTKKYPQFIDEERKIFSYMSYHERLLFEKLKLLSDGVDTKDSTVLEQFATIFREKLKGKIDPIFTDEFNEQISNMISPTPIRKYNPNNDKVTRIGELSKQKELLIRARKQLISESNIEFNNGPKKGFANILFLTSIMGFITGILFTIFHLIINK